MSENNTYTNTPNTILRNLGRLVKPSSYLIYTILRSYKNSKSALAFPGRELLAKWGDMSEKNVSACLKELADIGAIEIKRRFNASSNVAFLDEGILALITSRFPDEPIDEPLITSGLPTHITQGLGTDITSSGSNDNPQVTTDVTSGLPRSSPGGAPTITSTNTNKSTMTSTSEKPPTYSSKIPQVSNPIFWNPDTGKVEWPQFQRTGDEQLDLMAKLWYDYQIMWNWEVRDDDETRFREVPEWDDGHERHIWAFTQAFVTKDHNHAMRMAYRYMFLAFFSPDIWLWRKKSMKPTWEQLARFGDELVISKYQELKQDGWEYEKSDAEAKAAYALRQQRQQQMGAN